MSAPATQAAAKSILIFGATGAIGRLVLHRLLTSTSGEFRRIVECGRRVTPRDELAPHATFIKLEQRIVDFDNIANVGLEKGKYDVVIITLGTTRAAAGSLENFVKIDREYVLAAARAARAQGVKQRLLYVSAARANSSSYFVYPQSKGLTEEGLAQLGCDDLIVLRPAFLRDRNVGKKSILEHVVLGATGLLAQFSPDVEVLAEDVAKSILFSATHGSSGLPASAAALTVSAEKAKENPYTVVPNRGLVELAKLS